ncbi:MAG: crossover junction endodeoxyribonuclease RuvC [Coriobacteriia bacterium]|nr:crossover junction endodeoxyribonuclease RuvC [Coriobacteriia bacterium]MBS5477680.1 crossover junction endodeoxyribonuclease RuvC [Coriobacteriia bacterium]
MIILGIDPGLAHTGWGVIETRGMQCRARAYGCIETDTGMDIARRLKRIHDEISRVIGRYHPTDVAIEEIFFSANSQSAVKTAHARGAALVACASCGLETGEYTPMQIKQAVVGTGAADKRQVQFMVKSLLHLEQEPRPDHCADALAAAICHAHLTAWREMGRSQHLTTLSASSYAERGTRKASASEARAAEALAERKARP